MSYMYMHRLSIQRFIRGQSLKLRSFLLSFIFSYGFFNIPVGNALDLRSLEVSTLLPRFLRNIFCSNISIEKIEYKLLIAHYSIQSAQA